MRYEIVKAANGYMVIPVEDYRNGGGAIYEKIWVFTTYTALADKLQHILDLPNDERK